MTTCWWLDRMVRTRPAAGRAHGADLARLVRRPRNDGVGRQPLMLRQNALFRGTRSGRSTTCCATSRATRRCCCCSTASTTARARRTRTTRARCMELFSLGADRGAYTENDVRELAPALTGWRNDWSDRAGPPRTSASTPTRHDTSVKTIFGQTRQLRLAGRVPAVRRAPAAPVVLRAKLWSYFVPTAPAGRRRRPRCRALYVPAATQIAPGARGDPARTRLLRRARRWSSRRSSTTPGCCARVGRGIDTDAWAWLCAERRPAPVLSAQRLGLGRHALAGHVDAGAGAGTIDDSRWPRRRRRPVGRPAVPARPRTPATRVAAALAVLGRAALTAETRAGLLDFAAQRCRATMTRLAAAHVPGDAPERAAPC